MRAGSCESSSSPDESDANADGVDEDAPIVEASTPYELEKDVEGEEDEEEDTGVVAPPFSPAPEKRPMSWMTSTTTKRPTAIIVKLGEKAETFGDDDAEDEDEGEADGVGLDAAASVAPIVMRGSERENEEVYPESLLSRPRCETLVLLLGCTPFDATIILSYFLRNDASVM